MTADSKEESQAGQAKAKGKPGLLGREPLRPNSPGRKA